MVIDDSLGKTKHYALRIEFQKRGNPDEFIKNTLNGQLSEPGMLEI